MNTNTRTMTCDWPEGCNAAADIRPGAATLLAACFGHFIETGEAWRTSMLRADAAGIDWRRPLRERASR